MTLIAPELDRELAGIATRRPTSAPAPSRSLAQRRAALVEANRIRVVRARLKLDLKAGRTTVWDVLDRFTGGRVDEDLATMKVDELLVATPKIGRVKANTLLQRSRISPSKTLGGLTTRQRGELERALCAYPAVRR